MHSSSKEIISNATQGAVVDKIHKLNNVHEGPNLFSEETGGPLLKDVTILDPGPERCCVLLTPS